MNKKDKRKVFTLRCDKDFKKNIKQQAMNEKKTVNQYVISMLIKNYSSISPFSVS